MKNIKTRQDLHINWGDECLFWNKIQSRGYPILHYKDKTLPLHRLMHAIFKGPIPKNRVVMHTCDNKNCINPLHLKIGTIKDNNLDAFNKGRNDRFRLARLSKNKAVTKAA